MTACGENGAEIIRDKLSSRETSVLLDTSERLGKSAKLIFSRRGRRPIWHGHHNLVTHQGGYAVIVISIPPTVSHRISLNRLKGLLKRACLNRAAARQVPEVAPPGASTTSEDLGSRGMSQLKAALRFRWFLANSDLLYRLYRNRCSLQSEGRAKSREVMPCPSVFWNSLLPEH